MSAGRALVLLMAGVVVACGPAPPDEAQIRARIDEMQQALEEGNVRAFLAPVAEDFSGEGRNIDRRGARLLLNRELRAHERLKARLFDIEVELRGEDRATASMHAVTTGGSGLIPDTGRWYRVESGWRRDDGEWMLISARWKPVAGR